MRKTNRYLSRKAAAALFLCAQMFLSGGGDCLAAASAAQDPEAVPDPYVGHVIDAMLAEGEYLEGEAIALVRKSDGGKPEGEEISSVRGENVTSAVEGALKGGIPAAAEASRRMAGQAGEYTVSHIVDHDRSTRDILLELYSDPDTIAAEPNYVLSPCDAETEDLLKTDDAQAAEDSQAAENPFSGEQAAEGVPSEEGNEASDGASSEREPMPGDLSPAQWDLGKEAGVQHTVPDAPSDDYSMDPPGWQEGHNDPGAEPNSSGTICVMDSGLDVTDPEFQGVLYEFSEDQQKRFGCGKYGFNASAEKEGEDVGDLTDHNMHGTHVAGIIAANWDGHGISGIVHGAKIFGVRIYKDDGIVSDEASAIRGFEFLIRCAREVNLKAVNCSWGFIRPQLIQSVLVDALGAQGAVTAYASGNRSLDVDEVPDSGPSNPSLYAVCVDGAGMDGKMGNYSCWGQTSTDVFAPGSQILSTVPKTAKGGSSVHVYNCFFPELTEPEHLLYGPDPMEEGQSGVRFFDRNPALDADAQEAGAYVTDMGYDDRKSVKLAVSPRQSLYMAVPAEAADDVRWINAKLAMDRGAALTSISSVTCVNEAGEIVELDHAGADALNKGISIMCAKEASSHQWSTYSVDVQGFIDAANEVHDMSGEQREALFGYDDYEDPGHIDGVYAWTDGGRSYVIAQIGIGESEPGKPVPQELFVDDVALGDSEVVNGAYTIMSGTSMATPTVSASLAIVAKDEPENAALSGTGPGEMALERVAKLLASVDYDPDLKDKCRTGGRIRLGHLAENPGQLAPLIAKARCDDAKLIISGFFFGDSGTLRIDGAAHAYQDWSDREITADLSDVVSGSHVAEITNGQGAVMQAVVAVSNPEKGTPLLETALSVPVEDPDLLKDSTASFYGQMTGCGGKLYVLSTDIALGAIALWCFDPGSNLWEKCANVPESIAGKTFSGIAGYQGKIYVFGTTEGDGPESLWDWDPSSGKWTKHELGDDAPYYMGLCVLRDRLVGIGSSFSDDNNIWLVDPEQNQAEPVADTELPDWDLANARFAATASSMYLYAPDPEDDETPYPMGVLMRITIDDADGSAHIEDLSDILKDLIDKDRNGTVALAAGEDYCVIVADAKDGEDLHILRDGSRKAEACGLAAAYHDLIYPFAVMCEDTLYVGGIDETAPDVMFLRSQRMQ